MSVESPSITDVISLYIAEVRSILLAGAVGGAIAVAIVSVLPSKFSARATFLADVSSESDLSGLRGIAGQFGLPIPTTSSGASPEFFAALTKSDAILRPVLADSFATDDGSGSRVPLVEFLKPRGISHAQREEDALEKLRALTAISFDRRTGILSLRVRSAQRAVCIGVAAAILRELNNFNLLRRQSRARAERQFAESRASEARQRLVDAEEALRVFLVQNRIVGDTPKLLLERDRLQRKIGLRQQVLASVELSLEDARMREVKDTPVISVLEEPYALTRRDPRGRVKYGIFGIFLGMGLSLFLIPLLTSLRQANSSETPEGARLRAAINKAKKDLANPFAKSDGLTGSR